MPVHFNFEVHSPHRLFFTGRVESIILMLSDGEIGVYANHSPFSAPAQSCILRIKDDKGELRHAFISEGILEVKEHKTVLMVDDAEWPEEIDRERCLASKKEAEENLETALLKFEIGKAKSKIRRAEVRLQTSELRKRG